MTTTVQGTLGAYDPYSRSIPIVASTPNEIEGEALTSWDLERYLKNPVVMWMHDKDAIPIGISSDVAYSPELGLTARVNFASADANPLAEQIARCCQEKIIRACSVGYDRGENGGPAILLEISMVTVPLDEDAGTPDLNPEAAEDAARAAGMSDELPEKTRISNAARALAQHRVRQRNENAATRAALESERTDMTQHTQQTGDDKGKDVVVFRMDRMRLGKVERTQVGGAVVPAMLSRTGVLTYRNSDGSARRELRLPSEVFDAESLKTLEHAPVIDIKDHTGMVTPKTWRDVSLGHVGPVKRDGNFVASKLIVQDHATLDQIENEERTEVSCGYQCNLEFTPGVHEGEAYDCIQRNIRYNHAALCPPNRGRAGPTVGLRLDMNAPEWATSHFDEKEEGSPMGIKIRFDGREFEEGTREHLDAIERVNKVEIDKLQKLNLDATEKVTALTATVATQTKRADVAEGARDTATAALETFKTDATKTKAMEVAETEKARLADRAAMRNKVRLVGEVARFFGSDDEDDDEDDDDDGPPSSKAGATAADKKKKKKKNPFAKMDAKFDAMFEMTDRDLMMIAVKQKNPNFDATDRSDDYVRSRYDGVLEAAKAATGVDGVRLAMENHAARLDANAGKNNPGVENDPVLKAQAARDKATADAWKQTDATRANGGR